MRDDVLSGGFADTPVEAARAYDAAGADEICFLDIAATHENRGTLLDVVRRTADQCFVPLTVGGGVRAAEDARALLLAGADKVAVNSAAVRRPELIGELAESFGSQCVVAAIDAKRVSPGTWEIFTHGGREPTGVDALAHARRCVAEGAGEILLTSMDRDGTKDGFDLDLTRTIADAVAVPVIASGGVGHAAVSIARHRGAIIYGTCSKGKREYATKELGIPPENLGNSRDESFYEMIKERTNGEGVDIVLNRYGKLFLQFF